jgi:hypothetical protein
MPPLTVVKHLHVFEQAGSSLIARFVITVHDQIGLERVEKLSIGALSQQSPLRLMLC